MKVENVLIIIKNILPIIIELILSSIWKRHKKKLKQPRLLWKK
jgi:hypothetical protein